MKKNIITTTGCVVVVASVLATLVCAQAPPAVKGTVINNSAAREPFLSVIADQQTLQQKGKL
jgi:hypothetical protein